MKVTEKKGIKQWFINKWNHSVDFDVELEPDEEAQALLTGKYLTDSSDREKIIEEALVYWVILYMIKNTEEYNEKNN